MTCTDLSEILRKHKLWLQTKEGGECADLQDEDLRYADLECADLRTANLKGADLEAADLRYANLKYADLEGAKLRCANLKGANLQDEDLRSANLEEADLGSTNLRHANLEGANLRSANLRKANLQDTNIDYSAWPLWCGSLNAHVDDRIAVQLLYHTLSVVQHSPYVSEDIKRALLTPDVVEVANRFHHVDECGELEIFNGGKEA